MVICYFLDNRRFVQHPYICEKGKTKQYLLIWALISFFLDTFVGTIFYANMQGSILKEPISGIR